MRYHVSVPFSVIQRFCFSLPVDNLKCNIAFCASHIYLLLVSVLRGFPFVRRFLLNIFGRKLADQIG